MAETTGRKADLDKEGIALDDLGKAELDKEGIPLHDAPPQAEAKADEASAEQPLEAEPPQNVWLSPKRIMVMGGAAAAVFVLLAAASLALFLHKEPEAPRVIKAARAAFDDGIVLDPFMVFYETREKNRSGILIAQVSLKVDPSRAPYVTGRLYDVRNIIYRRLRDAASVYSQTEIALMLSDDLADYPIQEVSFLSYQAR